METVGKQMIYRWKIGIHKSKDCKKKEQFSARAVFTVEASLLMGIILPVLISILIAGFYVHDQAVLQGMACECAAMGSNLQLYKKTDASVEKIAKEILPHRMMWTRGSDGSASAGRSSASAQFQGSFPIPGAIAAFWTGGKVPVSAHWSRSVYHPADLIRIVRGVRFLADTLED